MKKQTKSKVTLKYQELDVAQKSTVDSKLYGMGFKKDFKNALVIEFGQELRNGQRELLAIKTPKGSSIRITKP